MYSFDKSSRYQPRGTARFSHDGWEKPYTPKDHGSGSFISAMMTVVGLIGGVLIVLGILLH